MDSDGNGDGAFTICVHPTQAYAPGICVESRPGGGNVICIGVDGDARAQAIRVLQDTDQMCP